MVFRGSPNQRGHGIGTFLRGLFRASLPYLKSGAKVVGRELLHTGSNFLDDLDADVPAKEALESRLKEAAGNLKRKAINRVLTGKGYKSKKRKKSVQSKRRSRKRKTSKKVIRKKKSRKTVKKRRALKNRRKRAIKNNLTDIFG